MKRTPSVAGQFYAGSSSTLTRQVEGYVLRDSPKEKVIAVMSPHAGLMYSGHVAGAVYSAIQFPKTFVLIGPNHTGIGADVAIMCTGEWVIPTASFPIDEALSQAIVAEIPSVAEDAEAHLFEHSLEVQLPFIAHFSDAVKIVPITVMKVTDEECEAIGQGIAEAIREVGYDVVIVASSDMSHYVPDAVAKKLDSLAITEILNLHPEGLYEVVLRERISMCGYIPATIMLHAAKALGASRARLVKYATSAEVSGDYDHVVGYAGVIIT
jgi:hypothetical protein